MKKADSNNMAYSTDSFLKCQEVSFYSSAQLNKKGIIFIQKCCIAKFIENKIDDITGVADNAKDEVYEISQFS